MHVESTIFISERNKARVYLWSAIQQPVLIKQLCGLPYNQWNFICFSFFFLKRNISIAINWVPNEVSSTLARRYLRRGLSVKYMLDDHVVEYIRQQKLYAVNAMLVHQFYVAKGEFCDFVFDRC